jgi:hypothetical protein
MTKRPIGLSAEQVSAVRTLTGTPVGADPTPWVDANLPKTPDPITGGAVNAEGFTTLWFDVEFAGGAGGSGNSIGLALLVRDEGAPDGQRWKHLLVGGAPQLVTLTGTGFVEAIVDGRLVFPCLVSVVGAPTGVTILAMPGTRVNGPPVD